MEDIAQKTGLFPEDLTLEALNNLASEDGHMIEYLGIEFTEIGNDFLAAKMPVDRRTRQPFGILHGGASVVLSETLGSAAAHLSLKDETKMAVGLEINANHVRPVKDGYVYGKTEPLHIGKTTQVWQTKIMDEQNRLVCVSRITVAIVDRSRSK
ncbi:thioesterase superfamily protein [Chloroherpeton thalassium ATCC 35110]|uniref:Thioesterase superfamily protein n=1 Tax=Chloroherpeton thalassium (strain ATCC 35110 / GB-78) TaxID=517418 RepID=B3QW48_CHLT3|nr:hotdog fold thioesterase [Chloroherpeton thalassium]ACF14702.1 thioesterase superfamily protein [Chloroherpeton thalassium ATCC 35110]